MENIVISKICGLCAGCKAAINSAKQTLESHSHVSLFKEIVHNESVNSSLAKIGIKIKNELSDFEEGEVAILRAHGEPKSTYEYLDSHGIAYVDSTCVNVKKIHEQVLSYESLGYKIIIIGKYGKLSGKVHPEILGTIGWCNLSPILIEDEEDISKLKPFKNEKFYLVCQTTFNIKKAEAFVEKITQICNQNNCELVINLSICGAQKMINTSSIELAKISDVMIVVGSKKSSNTTELYNNLSKQIKTLFLEDISKWREILKENNIVLSPKLRVGLTAGASTDKEELYTLKNEMENEILEKILSININKHSSIQIDDMFFDPYKIEDCTKKAKYIFITHPHYDHLSIEDINKVITNNTIIVATKDSAEKLEKMYPKHKKIYVLPNENLKFADFDVETIPAYNINKNFHKKEFNWIGYKIIKNNISYFVAGDTDITPELEKVKCDVMFVPIGGTYTMTALEASKVTNKIMPNIVVPTHYNCLVGNKEDEKIFVQNLNKNINVKILL